MNSWKIRLAAGLLSAAALVSLSACGANETAAAAAGTAEAAEIAETAGVPVQVRAITSGSAAADSTVSGTVSSDEEHMVMVAVTAKCLDTYAEAGDTVTKGQPLCRLDLDSTLSNYRAAQLGLNTALQGYSDQSAVFERQIAAINDQIAMAEQQIPLAEQAIPLAEEAIPLAEKAVDQAREQVSVLEQQLALLEKNLRDTKELQTIGAASQAEIDQLETQLSQLNMQHNAAKMQLDQAQVAVEQARLQLDQARLQPDQARMQVTQLQLQLQSAQATRNNTLNQLQASIETARSSVQQLDTALENIDGEGNVIAPADGLLVTFNATRDSFVSTTAPLAVINGAGKMEITVAVSESLISKLAAGDKADVFVTALGRSLEAVIRSVDRSANAMTKLYNVTLSIPEQTEGLLSGMFAEVTFHTDAVDSTILIPSEAILKDGGGQYVYIVENDTAKSVRITTGMVSSGVTEVTSGLSEGQKLVTVGQTYLSDGAAVRIVGEG